MNCMLDVDAPPTAARPASAPELFARQNTRSLPSLGSLLIWFSALAMVLPLLVRGPSCGPDFIFHFTSWHDALNSWHHGILYPHWASSPNFGAGEPRFVFYPPLTWMLGAALGAILPWHLVSIALSFLVLVGTGFATRALARQILADGAANLAACTAVFSGSSIYEIFHHGDFAVISGGLWIPLLLLLFFAQDRAASRAPSTALADRFTVPLALVLAGSWLSNTPLGLMASYLLATMALLSAVHSRSWKPLARTAIAAALGLGLAGFYLVPASVEQHWVDIQKLFASPEHLIQNRWVTSELRSAHERKRGIIEIVMLAMALGGLLITRIRDQWPSRTRLAARRQWLLLAAIPCAVLVLLLPISLPVWNVLPRLRFLQYPWRWMVVLQAPMAIFFAAAVWSVKSRLRPYALTACGALFLMAALGSGVNKSLFRPGSAASSGPYSLSAMDRALAIGGSGVGGADEYATPPGAHNDLIATGLPDACLVRDPSAPLSNVPATNVPAFYTPRTWSAALGTCDATFGQSLNTATPEHLQLTANVTQPGYLVLRLRNYPAWDVVLNGHPVRDLATRADGLMAIPVAPGPVDLAVTWKNTPDVFAGRFLTALSALLAGSLWWWARKRSSTSALIAQRTAQAQALA